MSSISELRKKQLFDHYLSGQSNMPPLDAIDVRDQDLDIQNPDVNPSYPPGRLREIASADQDDGQIDLRDLYHEDTDATKRFEDLLNKYPERHGPTLARAIVAGGLGLGKKGSYKDQQDFLNAPNDRNIEDWKNQIQPAYNDANLERQSNINNRTLAYNTAQARNVAERNRITEQKNTDTAEANRIRNDAIDYKNHNYIIKDEGSRIIAINPHDPTDKHDLGPSGKLDQRDLENLKGQWGVQRAEASGAAAMNRLIASGKGMYQDPSTGKRYRTDPDTGDLEEVEGGPEGPVNTVGTPPKPSSATGTPRLDTPTQADLREQQNMRKLYNTNQNYQQFFKKETNGKLSLRPRPSDAWFGDNSQAQKDYDALLKQLYPDAQLPTNNSKTDSSQSTQSTESVRIEHSKSTGKYRKSTDGGKTWKVYDSYPQ